MELSGILTVQDWFPIPCYNVMNNNTQGWILYYQCNEKIVFQSVLTARKQQTNAFRSGQLKLSANEGKPLKKANRGTALRLTLTLRNMEGDQVLLRHYVFVIGIFTTLPSISRGNTLTCVQAVYIFSSLAPLENFFFFGTFLKLPFFPFVFWTAFSQGSINNFVYVNFMISEFSYLNITSIGRNLIEEENDCGYTCLEDSSCFSYNVAAFPDVNGKLLCELLPSDKYNNSDKFNASEEFHHFYIPVSQTTANYLFITTFSFEG